MEPMTLGSPPSSPGQSPQANPAFLPAFLMGDTPAQSPQRNNQLSPTKNRSFGFKTPTIATNERQIQNRFLNQPTPSEQYNLSNNVPAEKSGPPTLSLFDTLDSKNDFANSTRIDGRQFSTPTKEFEPKSPISSKIGTPQSNIRNLNDSLNKWNSYKKPDNENLWVTVLGFPPYASSLVLTQFSHCGNIIDKKFPPDGNWVHIKFSNKHEVAKAMSYNGRLISNSVMIGVILHHEKENKENTVQSPQDNRITPTITSPNRARSLTQPYALSQNTEVLSPQNVPQRSTGIVTKAMEYVFGWS